MRTLSMRTGLICFVVVVMLAVMSAGALAQDDDAPVLGAVNVIEPNVFVTETDGEERPVFDLTSLESGEALRTDETGVALVTWFYDGTEVVLGANAQLTINSFSGESDTEFEIDLTLDAGHLAGGIGSVASASGGTWKLSTPAFMIQVISGQFEVMVNEDGTAWLVVTKGSVELAQADDDWVTVEANHYFAGDGVQALSDDGVTPNVSMDGICTASASTNLVVRMFPSENSQRLDGVPEGQTLWVRAGTQGKLWLQVYFETDPVQDDLHNYGWVYGPATVMDEAACDGLPRVALVGRMYGGPGVDNADSLTPTEDEAGGE